ncbi:MAG: hypothetical protein SF053_13995 [Bacteroidia bacterium]|nr:hypothetical protein [Bacteroidia bacterium]
MRKQAVTYLGWITAGLLTACGPSRLDDLESQHQALLAESRYKDSLVQDFLQAVNETEENMRMIQVKESMLTVRAIDPELQPDRKTRLLEDIVALGELLEHNQHLIAELENRISQSQGNLDRFNSIIRNLDKQLAARTQELAELKTQVESGQFDLETLNRRFVTLSQEHVEMETVLNTQSDRMNTLEEQMRSQESVMRRQASEMYTGYLIMGTSKELKQKGVLVDNRLAGTLDQALFTQVNTRETTRISLAQEARLLTPHPADTYQIKSAEDGTLILSITDVTRFWRNSKYVVVVYQ